MKRIALALVASVGLLTTATAANTYNVVPDWLKLPPGHEQLGNQHGDIAVSSAAVSASPSRARSIESARVPA